MGAIFLVKRTAAESPDHRFQALQSEFRKQGWTAPDIRTAAGCDICVFPKRSGGAIASHVVDESNFCLSTGTLIYRKKHGSEALEQLHNDLINGSVDWGQVYGHFCVIAAAEGKLSVFVDRLGTYPVFHDRDNEVLSSTFLGVVASMTRPAVNPQCVYEYVFQGATYGDETVFHGIGRLDGSKGIRFQRDKKPEKVEIAPALPRAEAPVSFDDSVDRNVENLKRYFQALAGCFGEKIDTALSGGYDSRLTLALLRDQGIMPRLHVYGRKNDDDVRVAKAIATGEKFTLAHTDKSGKPQVAADRFADIVARNFYLFDGTPPDGILDDGADVTTRLERCAGGELMLNGGGGEVFRNFFYLSDRAYRTRRFLWSFYNRFDPRLCTARFNENGYFDKLGTKVRQTVGTENDVLTRQEIESLYPAFRCRYWMGRNNGVNNALGYALTPFIDANIVPDAIATPLKFKNYGRLEGAMIQSISPTLAAYESAYGHNFSASPPHARKIKDLSTLLRPPELRRFTYRLHKRSRDSWAYYLKPAYIAEILGNNFEHMGRFVQVDQIADGEQFARICTLEYLFQRVDAVHGD
ncbi:MAG: hypothetical protein HOM58_05575 [Rhodospirillaceae bacterium]|jgi:hypothetical protein|nr:hypothetical protein [Rhodospirillaceae bacterium]MBT5458935.1 hypothetical protein [Rhodospirillaceae bacterium]